MNTPEQHTFPQPHHDEGCVKCGGFKGEPCEPPASDKRVEKWEKEFDEKFCKIVHMHRGECAITDTAGTRFQAHTENGLVTEVGGVESIKDFIRTILTQHHQDMMSEVVKRADMEIYAYENTLEKSKELGVAIGHKRVYARAKLIGEYKGKLEAWREIKEMLTEAQTITKSVTPPRPSVGCEVR